MEKENAERFQRSLKLKINQSPETVEWNDFLFPQDTRPNERCNHT